MDNDSIAEVAPDKGKVYADEYTHFGVDGMHDDWDDTDSTSGINVTAADTIG